MTAGLETIYLILGLGAFSLAANAYARQKIKEKAQEQYESLFENSAFGATVIDIDGHIVHINKALRKLIGCKPEHTLEGASLHNYVVEEDREPLTKFVGRLKRAKNRTIVVEKRLRRHDGEIIWVLASCTYISHSNVIAVQVVDITDRKEAEETIFHLAYYDSLTGLPNRLYFTEQMKQVIAKAKSDNSKFAVFLVDVDDFKNINDTYGHAVGDTVLKEIAVKLSNALQPTNDVKRQSFVARLAGDEYVCIVEDVKDQEDAKALIESVYAVMSEPIRVAKKKLDVSVSVGVSLFPDDGTTASILLKSADLALYAAKEQGKNGYYFHEPSLSSKYEQDVELVNCLHYFIGSGDFDLLYQPITDTLSGEIVGVEVLFGGNKEKYPQLNTQKLFTVAEQSNLIIQFGEKILHRGCVDYVAHLKDKVDPSFFVSVNISSKQFDDEDLILKIKNIMTKTKMPAASLGLEITETFLSSEYSNIALVMKELTALGITFSIDDFGKGYSSMAVLRSLPVHKLKIDKSFVDDITTDKKAVEIAKTIVRMAQTLNLTTVAEGVETEAQAKVLADIGCDRLQGFLVAKPMKMDELVEFIS